MSFLSENECRWDFGKSRILINDQTIPLYSRPGLQCMRRVIAAIDVVVPARHIAEVPVKIS